MGHSFPFSGGAAVGHQMQQQQVPALPEQPLHQLAAERLLTVCHDDEAPQFSFMARKPLAVVVCRDAAQSLGKRGREDLTCHGRGGSDGMGMPLCSPQKRVKSDGMTLL